MRLKTLKSSVPLLRSALPVAQPMSWRAGKESSAKRGYGYKWQQARAGYLAKHPLCVYCEQAGRVTEATVVDHRVPHQGDQKLFWDKGMAFIALCRKHGVKPIMRNTIPIGGTNTASDANRLADNAALAKLAASGVCILLDANAIVTDGATPQRIRADMNYDGTHMNQAAQNAVGAQLASLLR